jgi:hypothetical protein
VLGYEPDGVATFIILGALYFIPTIIAIVRKMANTGSVMVINFFLDGRSSGGSSRSRWPQGAHNRARRTCRRCRRRCRRRPLAEYP